MKIISKYKDFYDSYGFILGKPDECITYVRTTEVIDDDNKQYKSIIKKLYDYGHLYFHVYGFKEDYVAWVESVVCGIYPYIYICPFYVIMQQLNKGRTFIPIDLKPIPISEEFVHDKSKREHIYNKVQTKFDEYCDKNNIRGKLHIQKIRENNYSWNKSIFKFETQSWKIENPDVFRELNVPTFMYVCKNDDIARYVKDYGLTLNPIFVKQNFDVLGTNRTRIINEQNVYIDIENFLWEMKKEPESIPDNKTKIINAGFDLKTSFRNM